MGSGQQRIVITEIPYDTFKSKTVERMEQLRMDGKVPDVLEVRDESGRDGLRIAIDLKKGANAEVIINYYFKNTDLQINCNYNMVSICNRRPMKLGVLPIIDAYIEHQKEVVTNRTNFNLAKAKKRLHIVEGLRRVIDITDDVIHLIRASKSKQDSIDNLVAKFEFSPEQAEAIVMMRLYSLSHQDIEALQNEYTELNKNIDEYNKILASEKELLKVIKNELQEINKELVVPRRTEICDEISNIKIDETDLVSKEQTVVSISREGYLKRANLKAYNASKANGLKENDSVLYLKELSTLDTLLIFTSEGNYIYLPVYKIPEAKFKDVGTFITSLVQVSPKEKFIAAIDVPDFNSSDTLLFATKKGQMKQSLLNDFQLQRYSKAVRCMKLNDDELVSVDIIKDPLEVMAVTRNAEVLRFRASDISLYGSGAGGVKSINLKNGDYLVSAFYCNKNDDCLLLTNRSTLKRIKVTDIVLTKKARAGSAAIKKLKSNPYLIVDAKKMTPNQYKENVSINLMVRNGNTSIEAFSLKYNISDCGRTLTELDKSQGELVGLNLPAPTKPDDFVSPEYLVEVKEDLFSQDFGIEDEKPLESKPLSSNGIFDELDLILQKENRISSVPDEDDSKKEVKEIKYRKISLFDEDE